MTLLMVAAILPITASAAQYARIVVELNEPYYGDNLAEILPEIKIEAAYPFIDGYAFTVYYDAKSDEDGFAAAEKLKDNPLVKAATYCPDQEVDAKRVRFTVTVPSDSGRVGFRRYADLAELLPNIKISKAEAMMSTNCYYIYCDVETREEICLIYDELIANPDIYEVYYWCGEENEVSVGRVKVTLRGSYLQEEVTELFPELEIESVNSAGANNTYYLMLKEKTLKETLEAVDLLKANDNALRVGYSMEWLHPTVMPNELEEYYYNKDIRAEITVETALQALRIAAGITVINMEVINDDIRETFWLYDVDIDDRITVSDALSLLRIAAGIKA